MGEFRGLIDLITMKALYYKTEDQGSTITEAEIPDDFRGDAEVWRETMLDALSDFDETFAEEYMAHLEGAELTEADIDAALRRATLTGRAQPVLCGSSFKYVGVQRLLDAVAAYLPSPLDKPPIVGIHPKKGTEVTRKPTPTSRSAASSSRSRMTPTATSRSSGFTRGELKAGAPASSTPARTRRRTAPGSTTSAPTTARRSRRHRRRHRRRRRPEGLRHRRHALRRRAADPAREDRVPRDGHQHVDRAASARPTRGSSPTRSPRWPGKTRPSPTRSTRRPARRSSRGWANCTWRSSRTG